MWPERGALSIERGRTFFALVVIRPTCAKSAGPPASYFIMSVGAVADLQVASPGCFPASIPYSSARVLPFSLRLGVVVIALREGDSAPRFTL
jgi:hypothetical protein